MVCFPWVTAPREWQWTLWGWERSGGGSSKSSLTVVLAVTGACSVPDAVLSTFTLITSRWP